MGSIEEDIVKIKRGWKMGEGREAKLRSQSPFLAADWLVNNNLYKSLGIHISNTVINNLTGCHQ